MVDFQKRLNKIDQEISNFVKDVEQNIDALSFDLDQSLEFKLSSNYDRNIFNKLKDKKGIYFIEINLDTLYHQSKKIKTKVNNFIEEWSMKKYTSVYSAKIIKSRAMTYRDYEKSWLPLYIGKCKDIKKRVLEHIELSTDKRTYAMKLMHRTNLYNAVFRISYLELTVDHYDFIAPFIERTLRAKYLPIIGKQ